MKSTAAAKLPVCLGLLVLAAAALPGAESVAWVIGEEHQGYTGTYLGRYDEWLVGHPRKVAAGTIDFDSLGSICSGSWFSFSSDPSADNDTYDFICATSADEITANSGNVEFYVGDLNQNGVTIAQCSVIAQVPALCDSDTLTDGNALDCTAYLECL